LEIGDFRCVYTYRVLEWDAYDIIVGMDWVKHFRGMWDFDADTLVIRNGSGKTQRLPLKPFRTIDAGASLNVISAHATRRMLRKPTTQTCLWAIREIDASKSRLPAVEDPRFQGLVHKYRKLFRDELPTKQPIQREVRHEIVTGDAKPVNLAHYRLSKEHRDEQERQVKELLEKGIIQPSSSPWGFPVLFVSKPGDKWRMCIDYRALNAVTLRDGYPLPRIQECIDEIGSARRLTKIDLTSGYWQIHMESSSVPKTAFNTNSGKFEFLVMPFGLTNAPATFQRIMNTALQEFLHKFVIVYLDDIVIYSDSDAEHEEHLEKVFRALQKAELFAKPSKCIIGAKELEFCGHIVGNGQIKPTQSKVKSILDWPTPQNVHEVRQFIGLAGYYRRFIKGFASICAPLHELLKESDADLRKKKFRPIKWNPQCELAFQQLKHALVLSPVLQQPNEDAPYVLETDASEWAVGCVLMQIGPDGKLHPVAYDGKKLSGAELNYPVHEKELLAIKYGIRTWSHYLQNGTTTTVVTDHESLKYLNTTKTPSKRLARWISEFGEYSLDIKYRKGEEAVVPDAISRRPDLMGKGPANRAWVALNAIPESGKVDTPLSADTWSEAMILHLRGETALITDEQIRREVETRDDLDKFATEHDMLFRIIDKARVPYIVPGFRRDFIAYYHEHYGHFSAGAMMGVCKSRGWWPTMAKDITAFAQGCAACQLAKPPSHKDYEAPNHQIRSETRPFQRWGIDFIGICPTTPHGNRWILTAIDVATGWPLAKAVPEADEETVAHFLYEEIYCRYGAFQELLSDNGANLTSRMVDLYLDKVGTKHRTTTPYHPRTNGKTERLNGMLGRILTKVLMNKPIKLWDEFLPSALWACRIRAHTVSGISPFKLVYGLEPRLTGDQEEYDSRQLTDLETDFEKRLLNLHTSRHEANYHLLLRAVQRQKIRSESTTKADLRFKEGDSVMVRNENKGKFESTYFGPFYIKAVKPLGTYVLETKQGMVLRHLIHGSRITSFIPNGVEASMIPRITSQIRKELERQGAQLLDTTDKNVADLDKDPAAEPTYMDLTLMSKKEWEERAAIGNWRSGKVGEGIRDDAGTAITARRKRERANRKKNQTATDTKSAPNEPDVVLGSAAEAIIETIAPPLQQQEHERVQREREAERRAEEKEIRAGARRVKIEKRERKDKLAPQEKAMSDAKPVNPQATSEAEQPRERDQGTYGLRKNPTRKERS
jgi:transposase InsO family protein